MYTLITSLISIGVGIGSGVITSKNLVKYFHIGQHDHIHDISREELESDFDPNEYGDIDDDDDDDSDTIQGIVKNLES